MNRILPFATALALASSVAQASDGRPTPEADQEWYNDINGFCQENDLTLAILGAQMMNQKFTLHDVEEDGKVVETKFTLYDGFNRVTTKYYRGKARCEAALSRRHQEMKKSIDRYQ